MFSFVSGVFCSIYLWESFMLCLPVIYSFEVLWSIPLYEYIAVYHLSSWWELFEQFGAIIIEHIQTLSNISFCGTMHLGKELLRYSVDQLSTNFFCKVPANT